MFYIPPIKLVETEGFLVVRDDEVPGGTKVRVLRSLLPVLKEKEVVYAAHPYGYGALALAIACEDCDKQLTLFYPHISDLPKPMVQAIKKPCVQYFVVDSATSQVDVHQYAQKYVNLLGGRYLFPVGFDFPDFFNMLVSTVGSIGMEPKEVWAVAGSGCMVRAMASAWPNAEINAISLGFPQLNAGRARVLVAPEGPEQTAQYPPPFPSASYYDAKLWRFVKEYATQGALVWNVAR